MSVTMNQAHPKVLYESSEIHRNIKRILSSPLPGERRVVIAAYVGRNAAAFLPNPEGLELLCALEPGATDAIALRDLQGRGAKVMQSERLHMKVYYSSERGAIICSANVSSNALGGGHLKEAGVFMPPGTVDIERLIRVAEPQPIEPFHLKELLRKSNDLTARQRRRIRATDRRKKTLGDWCRDLHDFVPWKLGPFRGECSFAETAQAETSSRYGFLEPTLAHNVKTKSWYEEGNWVLLYDDTDPAREPEWMYVDFVVPVAERNSEAYEQIYPFQAVQVFGSQFYPDPPFSIDSGLSALDKALREFGLERVDKLESGDCPRELIAILSKYASA